MLRILYNNRARKNAYYNCRGVAQVVARLLREQEAVGSSPATPTTIIMVIEILNSRKARLYRAFFYDMLIKDEREWGNCCGKTE